MRTLFVFLFCLLLLPPLALIGFAVERHPIVQPDGKVSFEVLRKAQALWVRHDPRRMPPGEVAIVRASERDLKAVLASGLAAVEGVGSDVAIDRGGVRFAFAHALPLPENPLGRFVNLRVVVAPSADGLVISRLSVGSIAVPPSMIEPAVRLALDHFLGPGKGAEVLRSITSVAVTGKTVSVAYRPAGRLVEDLISGARRILAAGDPVRVRTYYRELARIGAALRKSRRQSLMSYIRPLFAHARERSKSGDPIEENRAAVLALAVYFGDPLFEQVIGAVRSGALNGHRPRTRRVRLAGRWDLVRHFAISAGLALTGGSRVADLMGEAKEVRDSGGGSGFSFTDLAAGRAGVRFAETAVSSHAAARRFQSLLADAYDESAVFPDIHDLPEGMREATFRSAFRDIGGPAYRRLTQEIDRRIDAVPLYR